MKKHLNELQVYSGIAILFVTLVHGNAYYLINILKLQSYIDAGIPFNFIDKIVHVAVPMFIFIAGYKYSMNNKNEKYIDFLLKKIKTIFIPFFMVSIFCLFLRHLFIQKDFAIHKILKEFILIFLGINYAYQLWYIPMFLLLILSYPLIVKYIKDSKLRLFVFLILTIIFNLIGNSEIPYISAVLDFPVSKFVSYFYLFEIGSLFYVNKLNLKNGNKTILIYIAVLIISSLIRNKTYDSLFTIIVLNPVSVISFYYISLMIKNNKLFLTLGKYSFFIFLFHEPFFIQKFSWFIQSHGLYKSYLIAPIVSISSIILSIFVYKCLENFSATTYSIKNIVKE